MVFHLSNSMTRAEAIEYLQEHVAIPIEQIEIEVDRVITWPGQASSYKMGEMAILKLRRYAEEILGKDSLEILMRTIGPSKRVQPTHGWTVAAHRSTNCTYPFCPPQWGPVSTVVWAGRPSGPAAWLALLLLKAGDVETNPGPKHTRTQVWICDICHREINRKQTSVTSLRCNHSEHWVHLRCAHIRVDQYTDTWICHLHRGSRLPHATHTSPYFPLTSSKPLLHSPPTPPTPPHPKHQHTSNSPTSPLK